MLRLAFAVGYWRDKPLTHDEQEYLALGINLAAGRGFSPELPGVAEGPTVQRFSRAPLYPAAIAAVVWAGGLPTDRLPAAVPTLLKIVQSVAGMCGVWVVARLAARSAGRAAGTIAAWIAALYPPLVWICAYALSEALYSPVILASALALAGIGAERGDADGAAPDADATRSTMWRRAAVAGGLAGASTLIRPSALAFVPLACAWLGWKRRPLLALVLAVFAVLPIAPWTIRNYRAHGRLILVAAEGGVTFWTGNHPDAPGEGDLAANPHLRVLQQAFRLRHPGLTEEELEPLYYRDAVETMARRPLAWAALVVRKAAHVWLPTGPSYRLHSPLYYWTTLVSYLTVLPFAAAGLLRLRARHASPVALLLLAGSVVALSLVFFPQERFRIPVLDPTYVVLASAWLADRRRGALAPEPA